MPPPFAVGHTKCIDSTDTVTHIVAPMGRRITIRDIAKNAGVHFTTVSRALAQHPSIPKATRNRIKSIAEKLGYAPDPMLSSLMLYRKNLQPKSYQGSIAWITNYPERDGWAKHEIFRLYYQGARKRASEFGYKLDEIWLGEFKQNPKIERILRARNITGLLLCPQPTPHGRIHMNWNLYSAVSFGYSLEHPALHKVTCHAFYAMIETLRQLRLLGYQRPGFVTSTVRDARVFNLWSGAFLTHQMQHFPHDNIPLLALSTVEEKALLAWMEKYRPDVIISEELIVLNFLKKNRIRVPKDVGFATPSLVTHATNPSGFDEKSEEIGMAAAEMVVGMLQRNEKGIPHNPYYLLVRGAWKKGRTTSPQRRSNPPKK